MRLIGRMQGPESPRSAMTGSTCMARRAGIQQAASATTSSAPGTTTNVSGSRALTPNSRPESTRVSASAPKTPMARPAAAIRSPPIEHHPKDHPAVRAERDANADLLRPLRGRRAR